MMNEHSEATTYQPLELSIEELEDAQGGVAPLVVAIVKGAAAAGAGALVYKALDAIF